MKKIAIVGTQGVPAKYGGFETLAENLIGGQCGADIEYTVFCAARDYAERRSDYKGAKLRYIPFFHANGAQSTPYDILSLCCCIRGYDAVLLLGVSGGIFIPVFRAFFRKKLIVNIDGREHTRAKWGRFARWFLKLNEQLSVRFADIVVADNKGIQDYVSDCYQKPSALIAYGGDHAVRHVAEERQTQILHDFMLEKRGYALSVCRIEPENNCHITLEACAKSGIPLVFIGNWGNSPYGQQLRMKYGQRENLRLMDSLYDLDVLYTLRSNCKVYIHGHSAGGTNPSLVEAMYVGCSILTYDVCYNRATTFDKACYFKNAQELTMLVSQCFAQDAVKTQDESPSGLNGPEMRRLAEQHYTWQRIARQYEGLY